MPPGPVGVIANPASGKDIRRLVARAPVSTDADKVAVLRRFFAGAAAAGARDICYLPGPHRLAEDALEPFAPPLRPVPIPVPLTGSALDTRNAAAACRGRGAAAVLVLGGDGTCRAAAAGWPGLPILPISTGTNNVFPLACEPTAAGLAAGLVASGRVPIEAAAVRCPVIAVEVDGEPPDLALVDAALVDEAFTGSRAVWRPAELRAALLLRSDPAVTGLAAIGGALGLAMPAGAAIALDLGEPGCPVAAALAPGLIVPVPVRSYRAAPFGEAVEWRGPGIIALDGERERRLLPGQRARLLPLPDGPRLIDPRRALAHAARAGLFLDLTPGAPHAD